MKKLLIALGVVCLTLFAAGCGPSADKSSDQTTTTQDSGAGGAAAGDQAAEGGAEQ